MENEPDPVPEKYRKFMVLEGKTFKLGVDDVVIEVPGTYGNGRIALKGTGKNGEPIITITKNVDFHDIPDDEHVHLNDQGGKNGLLDALVEAGIVEFSGRMDPAGYTAYPLCKLVL